MILSDVIEFMSLSLLVMDENLDIVVLPAEVVHDSVIYLHTAKSLIEGL